MTRPAAQRRHRPGFTLVELLVVLVIIATLVALLIPAITAAVRAARAASVQAEISSLAQALADWKNKMGDYPPSRILLNESGFLYTGNSTAVTLPANNSGSGISGASSDVSYGQLAQRTVTAFRKFWPKVVMSTSGVVTTIPDPNNTPGNGWYDFNGDGVLQADSNGIGALVQGHQCLVFFLGGIATPDPNSPGLFTGVSGFAKNPANPFMNNLGAGAKMYGPNRNPPFYEFVTNRLIGTAGASYMGSNFGIPGYLDSLGSQSDRTPPQNYYVYFGNNSGGGFDPNDVNFSEVDATGLNAPTGLTFYVTYPVYPVGGGASTRVTGSPSPNPYTTGPTVGGTNVSYINGQTFQILSSGADGYYGVGGLYDPNSSNDPLPFAGSPPTLGTDAGVRTLESDNLTNFHNGKLK